MQKIFYIETDNLNVFIKQLAQDYTVFTPQIKEPNFTKETDYSYQKFSGSADFTFNPYRALEPLKSFFNHPKECVSEYFIPLESPDHLHKNFLTGFTSQKTVVDVNKTVIFGVKSCDLAGHKVQDFVFLEGVEVDTLYRTRRENIVLVSSDCTDFKAVCHCLAWEILPYPQEGFDLNLSPLNDGYLVEVGSPKAEALIRQQEKYFIPAKVTQISSRSIKRENLIERLKRQLLPQDLVSKETVQRLVKDGYHLETWKEFMLPCVECGGCNLICDTCHCFLLADEKQGQVNKKIRVWDSCLYANYARVAGGANPLNTRAKRLRNRFMKKFDFFVDNLGMPACCGCGRCIEVCPGKIDIREVLKDLSKRLMVKR